MDASLLSTHIQYFDDACVHWSKALIDAPHVILGEVQRSDVPVSAGVYAIRSNGNLIYIGKSGNLRTRICNQHLGPRKRSSTLRRKVAKYLNTDDEEQITAWLKTASVGWIDLGHHGLALAVEDYAIATHNPPFNGYALGDPEAALEESVEPSEDNDLSEDTGRAVSIQCAVPDGAWHSGLDGLRRNGFGGFETVGYLRQSNFESVPGRPGDIGVYVVVWPNHEQPAFLEVSTGGWFKGKDPSVRRAVLQQNWVQDSDIVYVGKAGSLGKPTTLRSRLRQFLDFGAGKAIGHWGGRLTWHLPDSDRLIVCWKPTPFEEPREVEKVLLEEFLTAYGSLPFANLVH
ncbi:GIY-YIG nuclease family protein [Roseovarius sp.]|uniref:GIY-YIG nuclease family protein n=1 Tax=Roseovarius sp. TaxID=1486281 RepID=UPI003566BBFB